MAGNIHKPEFRKFWIDTLKVSKFLQDFLHFGYKMPLFRYPLSIHLKNNLSARIPANREFVEESLRNGLRDKLFVEVNEPPHLILPIQVVERAGKKKRIVIDASRTLNNHIRKRKVTLDHLHKIADCFPNNWWMASMDVSSGYYHVSVAPEHQTLLGMQWTWSNGQTKYYRWQVAFLGISDLVYFFTKIMMPIKVYLHAHGIASFIYIDDCLVLGCSEEDCKAKFEFARMTWKKAGWTENRSKAMEPTQIGTFLGLNINLKEQKFFFPSEKLTQVEEMIQHVIDSRTLHIRELAKLYGLIVSGLLSFGPIIHLLCRDGYQCLAQAPSWECRLNPASIIPELIYLKQNLRMLNGYPMQKHELQITSSMKLIASDASDKGYAVIDLTCPKDLSHQEHKGPCGKKLSGRIFTNWEQGRSSTFRELLALSDFYKAFSNQLRGTAIIHLTDNQVVTYVMQKGSNKTDLQKMAIAIYKACKNQDIHLQVVWKRRSDPRLQLADEWSRAFDIESWGPTKNEFDKFCKYYPPFTFDLFASEENFKCQQFASSIFSPSSSARNAFTLNWSKLGFCWTCPPTRLLRATLMQIVSCKSHGLIFAPYWPSLHCWALFAEDGVHLNNLFSSVRFLFPFLEKGPFVTNEIFSGKTKFPMMLLRYGGDAKKPFSSLQLPSHCVSNGCNLCFRKMAKP